MDNRKRGQPVKSRVIIIFADKKVLSKLSKGTLYGTTRNSKKYDQLNLFRELMIA
jgi:hypothetical protein